MASATSPKYRVFQNNNRNKYHKIRSVPSDRESLKPYGYYFSTYYAQITSTTIKDIKKVTKQSRFFLFVPISKTIYISQYRIFN